MTLPLDASWCLGRYDSDRLRSETCPERNTCQRYMAWLAWERFDGTPNYIGIPVSMAVRDCRDKIEALPEAPSIQDKED